MPKTTERRRTFTVLEAAHKKLDCSRCRRALRAGERATTIVRPGFAEYRHAGRTCPPSQVDRHPFLR